MRDTLNDIGLPIAAIAAALLLFGVFVSFAGVNPLDVWLLLFKGAFGDWFSWQNTLQRAAPLMLTALCVAIPARAGLVIIGGEGALVLGGLACAALPYAVALPANLAGTVLVCVAGALAGALWIMLAGWLRQFGDGFATDHNRGHCAPPGCSRFRAGSGDATGFPGCRESAPIS